MNYQKTYDQLIANRLINHPTGYFERHHILPKCLGGSDCSTNIVHLTAREHYIAHLLLAKIHGGKLWFPVVMMSEKKSKGAQGYSPSKKYAKASENYSKWVSENLSGSNHPMFAKNHKESTKAKLRSINIGKKVSDDVKKKISKSVTGKNHPMYGKKHSIESRLKMSQSSVGRVMPEEQKRKIADSLINKTLYKFCKGDQSVVLTKHQFVGHSGMSISSVNHLVSGKVKTCKGWSYCPAR